VAIVPEQSAMYEHRVVVVGTGDARLAYVPPAQPQLVGASEKLCACFNSRFS
jgi:hypothetical protein